MKFERLFSAVVVLIFCAALSFSQMVNGTLLGTVKDASGAVVAGAKVTVTEANTGIIRSTETNTSGNYTFSDLPPGTYNVVTEQTGFRRDSHGNVNVVVNTTV